MDYEPLTVNIQYNPAMAQEEIIVCEGISIIDDAIPEGMETFSVSLDTNDPAVRFIIETAPIAITDNDGKCNHILLCSAMTASFKSIGDRSVLCSIFMAVCPEDLYMQVFCCF